MAAIDKKAVYDSIASRQPFSISFKFADRELTMFIDGIYARLLTLNDQLYVLNSVISIMREVVANAQKANAKRVYFTGSGLDINRPEDYKKGMKTFKTHFMQKPDEMSALLMKSDFTVSIDFSINDRGLSISVRNNAPVLPREMERIRHRIEKAGIYKNLLEAYNDIEDGTEGAGLGIALVIITLKNIGIDPSLFTIDSDGNATTVTLRIPGEIKPGSIVSMVKDRIIKDITELPPFPANIVRIMELCDDPNSSFDVIAGGVMSDPALTASVLKLSNSAAFISGKRIESVYDAVRVLGMKNVRSMVMASGARHIMEQRYARYEEIWEHSNRVACYARHIGQKYHGAGVVERASLAGLLHDLGKIILISAEPATARKIREESKNRLLITETFMEEIAIGISHSTIGGMVAEGWNFPEYLVEAIRCHHDPLKASPATEAVVGTVYLANMFCGIESRKYEYHYCYESILEKYQLGDEKAFNDYHAVLRKSYEAQ
ncbi:MAG TPA: HDOD domain-containing protein [Spirochaetota bacterium]|nr:HDOD domain-containing protein [Spirochaetota bacterium]HPC39712.1 HDOD domain-containing protein [Spirochaetota bacterium]HPL16820.1 HDOD domain-containing protein [Spirochaetota bacterium]HRS76357.1 HDOD domain-containing protein [Spirochaetota bacterium]HRT73920.1 HDOD domain-containing protein [Spirochaetota bacterium]